MAQLRLHAHTLQAETGIWQGHYKPCDKCDLHEGQDDKYVTVQVPLLQGGPEACALRHKFEDDFAGFNLQIKMTDAEQGGFYFTDMISVLRISLLRQTYRSRQTSDPFYLSSYLAC